jgi:heme/copper-type cytochrome/quinol oxidase subunit 3
MAAESPGLPARSPVEIVEESPQVRRERGERALSIGARLLAGATTFFFLAFAFAYFYLRALDQQGFWRPTAALLKEQNEVHVSLSPNQALGAVFVACLVISAALSFIAGRRAKRDASWVAPTVGAIAIALAAVAAQCIGYTIQHFGPTDGAFASVFCVWTGLYLIAVLGTMYWLEVQVATDLRERRAPSVAPGEGVTEYEHADRLLARGLDAAVFYWVFLAALGVIMYVILYLL